MQKIPGLSISITNTSGLRIRGSIACGVRISTASASGDSTTAFRALGERT